MFPKMQDRQPAEERSNCALLEFLKSSTLGLNQFLLSFCIPISSKFTLECLISCYFSSCFLQILHFP